MFQSACVVRSSLEYSASGSPKPSDSPKPAEIKLPRYCLGDSAEDVVVLGSTGGFSSSQRLGSGSFGTVWKLKYSIGAVVASTLIKDEYKFEMEAAASFQEGEYTIKVIFPCEGETLEAVSYIAQKEADILKTVYPEWTNSIVNVSNDYYAGLIMPFQPGMDLEKHFQSMEKFSWKVILDIAIRLIDAVSAIHARGYVHLDIKPANIILLVIEGCMQQFRVIDFGIAEETGAVIRKFAESRQMTFPHLSSDRKLIGEQDSKFTYAANHHDGYSVGYVLDLLRRQTVVDSDDLPDEDMELMDAAVASVRPHYDDLASREKEKLTEVRATFWNLLSRDNNAGEGLHLRCTN